MEMRHRKAAALVQGRPGGGSRPLTDCLCSANAAIQPEEPHARGIWSGGSHVEPAVACAPAWADAAGADVSRLR